MLQCFELTGEQRFLEEARSGDRAARDCGSTSVYQANLTAWGAVACMRLWRITDKPTTSSRATSTSASFFHNCEIWECEIGHAQATSSNFLGVNCLHDAPYMAMYECFESFAGLRRISRRQAGPNLDPAVRMIVSEYCKYALDRAWFYYPDALPPRR